MRDDLRVPAGMPRDDCVEPPRSGVSAHDVRSPPDGGGRLVRAGSGQTAHSLSGAGARIDRENRVELRDSVAAAEHVRRRPERSGRRVVEGARNAPDVL